MNLRCIFGHDWFVFPHAAYVRECRRCHVQEEYALVEMGMTKRWLRRRYD